MRIAPVCLNTVFSSEPLWRGPGINPPSCRGYVWSLRFLGHALGLCLWRQGKEQLFPGQIAMQTPETSAALCTGTSYSSKDDTTSVSSCSC